MQAFTPCLDGDVTAHPSPAGIQIAQDRLAILNHRIATQTAARDRLAAALESLGANSR
nr:hypothetical protein [Actinokineospora globicatena]